MKVRPENSEATDGSRPSYFTFFAFSCMIRANREQGDGMAKEIILYTAKMCGDCQCLKGFMEREKIDFKSRDIVEEPEYAREVEENTGRLGVPYLVIDGKWIRAYDVGKPFTEEFARSLLDI